MLRELQVAWCEVGMGLRRKDTSSRSVDGCTPVIVWQRAWPLGSSSLFSFLLSKVKAQKFLKESFSGVELCGLHLFIRQTPSECSLCTRQGLQLACSSAERDCSLASCKQGCQLRGFVARVSAELRDSRSYQSPKYPLPSPFHL